MVQSTKQMNPFPGLRPFEFGEEHLFFGRGEQADKLLARLQQHRFVAVVGPSGSGKSSLVQAGLLPALCSGFLQGAGSDWRMAIVRPGASAIRNLALGLNRADVSGEQGENSDLQRLFVEATLRRGHLGLVEAGRQSQMEPQENLLVVVDRFEEVFHLQPKGVDRGSDDEAEAFVKLLLAAVQQQQVPIYVVLTIRSDFLGDCARLEGLPEAINNSLYLMPKMTREQTQAAVEGPIDVVGAKIEPRLVQRLLNDMGEDADRLPRLQHALMRTWDFWQECGKPDEALDLSHYEAVGTMTSALPYHADDIYEQLTVRQQQISRQMFQRLTEREQNGREIRRPTPLYEIARVLDVTEDEVRGVVNRFRTGKAPFILPAEPEPLLNDTQLDICHVSLMRLWGRLKQWVDREAESARIYLSLAKAAADYREGRTELLQEPELSVGLNWRRDERPTAVWASRYLEGLEEINGFLQESVEARDRRVTRLKDELAERERARDLRVKQAKSLALKMAVLAVGAIAAMAFSIYKAVDANRARVRAERELLNAESFSVPPSSDESFALEKEQSPDFAFSELESEADPLAELDVLPQLESEIDPLAKWEVAPELASKIDLQVEWDVAPELESEADSVAELDAAPEVESEADPVAELDAAPELASEVDPVAELDAAPEVESEADPVAELDAPPEVESEADPVAELDAAPELESEADPVAELDAAPEVESEVEPLAELESEQLSETNLAPERESEPEPPAVVSEPIANRNIGRVTWPEGLAVFAQPGGETYIGGVAFNETVSLYEISGDGRWQRIRQEARGLEGWVKTGNIAAVE